MPLLAPWRPTIHWLVLTTLVGARELDFSETELFHLPNECAERDCAINALQHRASVIELPAPKTMPTQYLRKYLLEVEELSYTCKKAVRIGSEHDGGYVVCEDVPFKGADGCILLSYGIAHDDRFESQVSSRYGCKVHEFDPTVMTSAGSERDSSQISFHHEGIGSKPSASTEVAPTSIDGASNVSVVKVDTLQHHVAKFASSSGLDMPLLVKMDVEGAEWPSLSTIPDNVLERIHHLIIEVHMNQKTNEEMLLQLPSCINALRKLKSMFYLYNSHFNNGLGSQRPFPEAGVGYSIPAIVELSLVRKDLISEISRGPYKGHHELETQNVPGRPPVSAASFPLPQK